ncbi:MAG: photosynthetic reaction center cytochrome c subunit family protein [Acidobacteriota bacterium]
MRVQITVLCMMVVAGVGRGQAPAAGGPPQARQPLPNMQVIAESLGVQCEFCHPAERATPAPMRDIARQMIAMTREINARVDAALVKPTAGDAATPVPAAAAQRVDCSTCHRGVAIPKALSEIIAQTAVKQGADAAVTQYRDLRKQYYGRAAYDFGENTLISVSQRIANAKPAEAIALMKLNLEFFPNSSQSWAALAFAYTRKVDDASAITALEKAVELDPQNNIARGQLEQLKSYRRR